MEDAVKRILAFRDERNWKQFHTPENLAKSIVIEAGELLENFQWDHRFDLEAVRQELADVVNYCILMADALDVDLIQAIQDKIDLNERKYPVEKSRNSSKKYTDL
ncbi:nucleotide pyrophosphohydrolase [Anaerotalea alkaliphila]|uniref:Nucleotide pyrophosphohydrolase n=1 Tax=Anaerotalea alkaliphila TaxID=2662126 RepID=A0A7X5HTE6_9FIRM|nr:nucleotide pyrophosphohydrolase [Anaerotalea alkaliphila]NDL66220.1 nucleotide pyrophosphohydrolase [Anaerotalea alkaliphila]